jgi:hypothetical protein
MTVAERSNVQSAVSAYTLALNYLPLAQLCVGAALVANAPSIGAAVVWSLLWLCLLPPLVCRLTLLLFGTPAGRGLSQSDRAYKVWWFTCQWQAVFNRLPWLEELLRLIPGAYAFWIFLWGGRVSPLAYWAPGSTVVDRPLVVVEAGAVIGMGAGLTGHLGVLAPDGTYRIDIGAPRVGPGAMMGARSGLSAGAELAAGQTLPAGRLMKPFMRWDGSARREIVETSDGGA